MGIRNKTFERSRFFRYGLPKDILSKGEKTKGELPAPPRPQKKVNGLNRQPVLPGDLLHVADYVI